MTNPLRTCNKTNGDLLCLDTTNGRGPTSNAHLDNRWTGAYGGPCSIRPRMEITAKFIVAAKIREQQRCSCYSVDLALLRTAPNQGDKVSPICAEQGTRRGESIVGNVACKVQYIALYSRASLARASDVRDSLVPPGRVAESRPHPTASFISRVEIRLFTYCKKFYSMAQVPLYSDVTRWAA